MADKKKTVTDDSASIGDNLAEIEKLLKRIGVMYNECFAGGMKLPPSQLRLQIERMLRELTQEPIRNSSQRHKFFGLSATYASMQALWASKLRERETGAKAGPRSARVFSFSEKRVKTFLQRETPAQPGAQAPAPAPEAAASAPPAASPVAGASPLEKLFAKLSEVQKANGQTLPFQSAEQLGKYLAVQKAKLEEKTGMKGIQLKVAIEDGKLKVKAQLPEAARTPSSEPPAPG